MVYTDNQGATYRDEGNKTANQIKISIYYAPEVRGVWLPNDPEGLIEVNLRCLWSHGEKNRSGLYIDLVTPIERLPSELLATSAATTRRNFRAVLRRKLGIVLGRNVRGISEGRIDWWAHYEEHEIITWPGMLLDQ